MTSNLNTYFQNIETARSNRVREAETERHNRAVEQEEKRANVERETHNRAVLLEQQRHSFATEHQARMDLFERQRAAKATDATNRASIAESRRATNVNAQTQTRKQTYDYLLGTGNLRETARSHRAQEENTRTQLRYNREFQLGQLGNAAEANRINWELGTANLRLRQEEVDLKHYATMADIYYAGYNASTARKRVYADMFGDTMRALSVSGFLGTTGKGEGHQQKHQTQQRSLFDMMQEDLTNEGL